MQGSTQFTSILHQSSLKNHQNPQCSTSAGYQARLEIYIALSQIKNLPRHEPSQVFSSIHFNWNCILQQVEWGQATMVDAKRRLLANALLDFSNERFVLLSETCIPLFNFTTINNYLINSNHSFVGSIDDPRKMGCGRYNKRMWPTISLSDWRKGNQWFEVHRKLAVEIVSRITPFLKTIASLHVIWMSTTWQPLWPKLNRAWIPTGALLGLIGPEVARIQQSLRGRMSLKRFWIGWDMVLVVLIMVSQLQFAFFSRGSFNQEP